MKNYEIVIGLETHIQLNTQTKIFCSCRADSWEAEPNTNICPVCSGLPGVLPVLNAEAVQKGALLSAAMHAEVNPRSVFDRKNYFYPDLPKGFQITQFYEPIGKGGYFDLALPDGSERHVRINRLHLEEDAGKTKIEHGVRLVDFNRCGVPLIEMVTEPDLRSGAEAAQYLTQLRQLLRWIGVSEADMERGHLRCDANVSIREMGSTVLNTKTEIKNVNSIEAVRQGIALEAQRQIAAVEAGEKIESWTLDWDADKNELRKMRSKETEADYRYFREPDLLPVVLTSEEIEHIKANVPELPIARKARFSQEYQLSDYDSEILTSERSLSDFYAEAVKAYGGEAKSVANWMINELLRLMREKNLAASQLGITPKALAQIIQMVDEGKVNAATGKLLVSKVDETGQSPAEIVASEGLGAVSDDSALLALIDAVISASPKEVELFRAGKENLLGWFLGQVMQRAGGKADPKRTRELMLERLKG